MSVIAQTSQSARSSTTYGRISHGPVQSGARVTVKEVRACRDRRPKAAEPMSGSIASPGGSRASGQIYQAGTRLFRNVSKPFGFFGSGKGCVDGINLPRTNFKNPWKERAKGVFVLSVTSRALPRGSGTGRLKYGLFKGAALKGEVCV